MAFYTHATLWTDPQTGETWHALKKHNGAGFTDLSMSVLRKHDVPRLIDWARSHRMVIEDNRSAA